MLLVNSSALINERLLKQLGRFLHHSAPILSLDLQKNKLIYAKLSLSRNDLWMPLRNLL